MRKISIYQLKGLHRDDMRVCGYQFGEGEESICVLGAVRGNEIQQMYICSQLINALKKLEQGGQIVQGKSILVIPTINSYSINIGKRFWPVDNTDINRMFPGYNLGETTQRIAAGVFEKIKDYVFGIQLTSFYIPGYFLPHIRIMQLGYEDVEKAAEFGLPYIMLRKPRPYDSTTLNYNWQIWDTKAFSLYTNVTDSIDQQSAKQAVQAILNFMNANGIVHYRGHRGYRSELIYDDDLVVVQSKTSGVFLNAIAIDHEISEGENIGTILDPYTGECKEKVVSPVDGKIFFAHSNPLVSSGTLLYRIIPMTENSLPIR